MQIMQIIIEIYWKRIKVKIRRRTIKIKIIEEEWFFKPCEQCRYFLQSRNAWEKWFEMKFSSENMRFYKFIHVPEHTSERNEFHNRVTQFQLEIAGETLFVALQFPLSMLRMRLQTWNAPETCCSTLKLSANSIHSEFGILIRRIALIAENRRGESNNE